MRVVEVFIPLNDLCLCVHNLQQDRRKLLEFQFDARTQWNQGISSLLQHAATGRTSNGRPQI